MNTISLPQLLYHLHPLVITKFIDEAQEINVDVVNHRGKLLVQTISDHVKHAGVHSGDATHILPPFSLLPNDIQCLKTIASKVTEAFNIYLDLSACKSSERMGRMAAQQSSRSSSVISGCLGCSPLFPSFLAITLPRQQQL